MFGRVVFGEEVLSIRTAEIVKKIEKVNVVMGSEVGIAATRPEQYDNFTDLQTEASTLELIELTEHKNATVRSYAFWALSFDGSVDLMPIVLKHIDDNELVSTQFGCSGEDIKTGDFFIGIATSTSEWQPNKLSNDQITRLNHTLISSGSDLAAKARAINNAETTDELYPRLRTLVINENNQSGLVALAKFQNEQDVELILIGRIASLRKEVISIPIKPLHIFLI